jgi:4-amino-4-deoxy-L-arabinose transferase-like glycosyltransferase
VPLGRARLGLAIALAAACYLLFFHNLTGVGLIGPDEPRYAAIGREMARSGDWLTPRLGGEPWFEKPPLIYWMAAAGFRVGLGEDLAPRLPVALLSVAFLWFYWRRLAREFGARAAWFSTAILATSAVWLSFSHVGVTDLPMAAAFSAAMLLYLPWIERGDRSGLTVAAALLGVAVLAKGLVPLVLALPVVWAGRARWRDLLRPVPLVVFLAVAAPWYVLVAARYGSAFLADLFLKHHFERFATDSLQHVQPFWFYLPVFVAGLFPWSPLVVLLFGKAAFRDPRRRFLLVLVVFGLVFFSAAANKLPGYLLPLFPAACALLGVTLAESRSRVWTLIVAPALLVLVPVAAEALPEALRLGITHADIGSVNWLAMLPALMAAALVWVLEGKGRRGWAVAAVVAVTVAGAVWLEARAFPAMDRTVSARGLWRQVAPRRDQVCVAAVNRGWRYNLDYYSGTPLADCATSPRPLRIEQPDQQPPHLAGAAAFSAF